MVDHFQNIYYEMQKVESDFRMVYKLSNWAQKIYWELDAKGYFNNLQYSLFEYILTRLWEFAGDELGEDIEVDKVNFSDEVISNFKRGFTEIYKYLSGEKNYSKVFIVQENLLDEYENDFKLIYTIGKRLQNNILLNEETECILKEKLDIFKISTRVNIIYNESIKAILNINESMKYPVDFILYCHKIGNCDNELYTNEEKKYLSYLISIIDGSKPYRLSVSVNKTALLYTNIYFLDY